MLYCEQLAAEHKLYMFCVMPENDCKRPSYYDVVERHPLILTSEEDRMRIQRQLSTTFLKWAGHLWVLPDTSTQVRVLTGKAASISDVNWSREHISVILFVTVICKTYI